MPQGVGYGNNGLGFLASLGPQLGALLMAAKDNPAAVASLLSANNVPTPDSAEFGQLFNPTQADGFDPGAEAGPGFTANLPLPSATPQVRSVPTIPIGPAPAGGPPVAQPANPPPQPAPAIPLDPSTMGIPGVGDDIIFGADGGDTTAKAPNLMSNMLPAVLGGGTEMAKQPAQQQRRFPQVPIQENKRQPPVGGLTGAQRVPDNPVKPEAVAQLLAMLMGARSKPAGGGSLGGLMG